MPVVTFDSLDAVPEPFRQHAQEKNGKVEVDLSPTKAVNDLRRANESVVAERDTFKAKWERIAPLVGEDIQTFEQNVENWRTTAQKVADGELTASDQIEAEVAKRVTQVRSEYERQVESVKRETKAWQTRSEKAEAEAKAARIESEVQRAATDPKVGVDPTAMTDVMMRAKQIFTVDETGNLIAKDGTGKLYGADGTTPLTVKEWLSVNLKEAAPYFFKGSQGGGGGEGGERKGGVKGLFLGKYTREQWESLDPAVRMKLYREAGSPKNPIA